MFVKYKALLPSDGELYKSVIELRNKANEEVKKAGGISTWLGFNHANIWMVQGKPWKEVCMSTYPGSAPLSTIYSLRTFLTLNLYRIWQGTHPGS